VGEIKYVIDPFWVMFGVPALVFLWIVWGVAIKSDKREKDN
jgi:hypothetical protein